MDLPEQQLCELLSSSFAFQDFRELIRFHFNEDLENIVDGKMPNVVAFELVKWAHRTGRIVELFVAASKQNPNRQDLRAAANTLKASRFDVSVWRDGGMACMRCGWLPNASS